MFGINRTPAVHAMANQARALIRADMANGNVAGAQAGRAALQQMRAQRQADVQANGGFLTPADCSNLRQSVGAAISQLQLGQ